MLGLLTLRGHMKYKYLVAMFSSAALTGCASLENFTTYSSARNSDYTSREHTNRYGAPVRSVWEYIREIHSEKIPPKIPKDVLIVDFSASSREIQDACTNAEVQPVIRQRIGFYGEAKGSVKYDIDHNGNIINQEVLGGQWHVTEAALKGIAETVFKPPVFNGQRLFCKNVRETLQWSSLRFLEVIATRARANFVKQERF